VIALQSFDETLHVVKWLPFFLPLIVSCGGNTGGQSAALIITALTSGDVTIADWWRVLRREFFMGLTLGAVLGTIAYAGALLAVKGPPIDKLVVPITVFLVVTCSTLVGGALPLIFRRMGLDPALMSNPFVAGIIDITGIVIYMTVAWVMLKEVSAAAPPG
jgi:magnesium transporter